MGQGTLADASFESGAFVTGVTNGWTTLEGSVSFSTSHAQAGTRSLKADYGFTIDSSMAFQWVTIQPGATSSLSGWALTPVAIGNGHVGFMYIQFADANHNAINSAGARTHPTSNSAPR